MNVSISNIKPNPKNPRVIKDDKFEKLKKSIQEFPQMLEKRPLVCFTDVDGTFVVLGGNMRLKASKELGLKELPIILADDWNEEQRAEFIIKDNVGFGEWNWEELKADWDEVKLNDWGLDIPDFGKQLDAVEDDFDVVVPEIPKTVLGDLYEIGEHRLMCGDSTCSDAVSKLMKGNKADMVFTDPPYGMSYGGGRAKGDHVKNKKTGGVLIKAHGEILGDNLKEESLIKMVKDALINGVVFKKEGAAAYICFTWRTYSEFEDALKQAGYNPKACIVWNKKSIGLGYANYRPQHEFIFYCDGQWFGGNNESDVWELSRGATGEYVHPTQKPIELVARAIQNSSKKEDIILELFTGSGSGSTMVAAHQINRKCYGMELDPKYCDVIVNRMIKLDPSLKIKLNGVDVTNDWK